MNIVVKLHKGKFLNFPKYPVFYFSFLIYYIPLSFLWFFKKIFIYLLEKKRDGKLKDLDEIKYYNGVIIKLGKAVNLKTPINEAILKRII
jgi:hypothetical protein